MKKASANKSIQKEGKDTNKNAESQNDAFNKLIAGGMSLKDIESLGSLAKNMRQEEEPEYALTMNGPRIAVPPRQSPPPPNRDTKHPRATRPKIKPDELDDEDNSENDEIHVHSTDIHKTKPKTKIKSGPIRK